MLFHDYNFLSHWASTQAIVNGLENKKINSNLLENDEIPMSYAHLPLTAEEKKERKTE